MSHPAGINWVDNFLPVSFRIFTRIKLKYITQAVQINRLKIINLEIS